MTSTNGDGSCPTRGRERAAGAVAVLAACMILVSAALGGCSHMQPPGGASEKVPDNPRLIMMMARYEENQGNLDKALALYSRVDDPFAWLSRARIHTAQEDSVIALAILQKVISEGTYTKEALEMRIRIHARSANWQQAMLDTEELARKYPDNVQIQMNLANLNILTGDYAKAKEVLRALLGKADDALVYYSLSKACLGAREFTCAKESLNKAIEVQPDLSAAYIDLARIHTMLGETAQAEAVYLKLLDVDPYSSEAHLALVEYYVEQKRFRDAVEHLKAYYELNPDIQVARKLIVLELQEAMYDEALAMIKEIKNPTADDKYYLALAYAGLERYEDALGVLGEIPIPGSLGCEVTMLKASILKQLNRMDECIAVLEKAWSAYETQGTCNEIGYQLATELDTAGRREEGLRVALDLLEKDSSDPIALNFVGYVWADSGVNLDRAYEMIRQALDAKPEDPYILDSMAWVLHRMGRSKEALPYIERSLKALGDDPTVNEHMGDILKALGKGDRALDYYLKSSVLSRTANNDLASKINEFLKQTPKETNERSIP